mmetsp:Transcript_21425/g.32677  ORF Transcript_21425/g.32677 Transcript_21425/m.32677 type:complete len:149 (-) Transcript_21425:646-1092(-)
MPWLFDRQQIGRQDRPLQRLQEPICACLSMVCLVRLDQELSEALVAHGIRQLKPFECGNSVTLRWASNQKVTASTLMKQNKAVDTLSSSGGSLRERCRLFGKPFSWLWFPTSWAFSVHGCDPLGCYNNGIAMQDAAVPLSFNRLFEVP